MKVNNLRYIHCLVLVQLGRGWQRSGGVRRGRRVSWPSAGVGGGESVATGRWQTSSADGAYYGLVPTLLAALVKIITVLSAC